MILTEKALEHFNNWYWNVWFDEQERDFYVIKEQGLKSFEITDPIFLHALIIEFFDSVGVYITATKLSQEVTIFNGEIISKYNIKNAIFNRVVALERNSLYKSLIEKANQLYNENIN